MAALLIPMKGAMSEDDAPEEGAAKQAKRAAAKRMLAAIRDEDAEALAEAHADLCEAHAAYEGEREED